MDIQRLRNLTTGILHTKIEHVYEDLEMITRNGGIMSHMIPRVRRAIVPWLREQVKDERFWDGEFDQTHVGDFPLSPMSEEENAAAMKRFSEMPNPLFHR
jgi:hypothetical protein